MDVGKNVFFINLHYFQINQLRLQNRIENRTIFLWKTKECSYEKLITFLFEQFDFLGQIGNYSFFLYQQIEMRLSFALLLGSAMIASLTNQKIQKVVPSTQTGIPMACPCKKPEGYIYGTALPVPQKVDVCPKNSNCECVIYSKPISDGSLIVNPTHQKGTRISQIECQSCIGTWYPFYAIFSACPPDSNCKCYMFSKHAKPQNDDNDSNDSHDSNDQNDSNQ